MKKLKLKLIAIVMLVAMLAFCFAVQAATYQLVNGPGYTNATVRVGALTNQVGVVAAASTNTYNMGTGFGTWSNTNLWPSAGFILSGYPGTLYGPAHTVLINNTFNLMATNASSTAVVVTYAGYDGFNWTSNYYSQTITIPVNTLTVNIVTNYDMGAIQALALQSIVNPGANILTNTIIDVATKPGF